MFLKIPKALFLGRESSSGKSVGNPSSAASGALESIPLIIIARRLSSAGIGTGEMIRELSHVPSAAGIRRPVIQVLAAVAGVLKDPRGRLKENLYAQHKFPWFLFKQSGEWGWRFQLKKNTGRWNQINARPLAGKISGNT